MWEMSQRILREVVESLDMPFYEAEGEGAFYGPKLDVQIRTALGKEETLSTVQLDFLCLSALNWNMSATMARSIVRS